jgi:hypothetical protein
MALDQLNPVAPPGNAPLQPLPPRTLPDNTVTNVMADGFDNKEVKNFIDPDSRFNDATNKKDSRSLVDISKQYPNTPVATASDYVASVMDKNTKKFDELVAPIKQAGGISTTDGKAEAMKAWAKSRREPQYLEALKQYFLGNPNSRYFVSGGTIKSTREYSQLDGRQLEVMRDETGQTHEIFDTKEQRYLNPQEYNKLGGGIDKVQDTIQYKNSVEMAKEYQTEFLKNEKIGRAYAASADQDKQMFQEREQLLKDTLGGSNLTDKQKQFIAGIATSQVGFTQSVTKGKNDFDQFSKAKGENISEAVRVGAEAYLQGLGKALGKIFKFGAEGSVTDENGRRYGTDELNNLQNTFSKNQNFEQNYNRTKADIAKSEVYKNLSYDQKLAVERIAEIDRTIEQKSNYLNSNYGQPSFLLPVQSMGVEDNFARAFNQSVKGQFNADAIKAFDAWRNDQLKNYPPGTVPKPNELENAFTNTDIYKGLKKSYADYSKTINTQAMSAPSKPSEVNQPQEFVGGSPQAQINKEGATPTPKPTDVGRKRDLLESLRKKHRSEGK